MFIESLTLRGIKSYREEVTIPFREGINFIAGRNGAGKTTIIESIGYLLFWIRPYQYKDLLSTGAKEGFLSVTFRGNDERSYTIAREIRKDKCKYVQLTDLQTGKVIEGEDVVREQIFQIHSIFSLDHLEEMFQEIVAVTQGKFTAPFLENGMEKKRKFQRMFGLETYEEAYKLSSQLPGILKDEIHVIENNIKNLEGQLLQKPEEEEKAKVLKSTLEILQKDFLKLQTELNEKEKIFIEQKKTKETLEKYEKELNDLIQEYKTAKQKEINMEEQVKKSTEAKTICDRHEQDHKKYIETEKTLEKLSENLQKAELVERSFQAFLQQETKILTEKDGFEKRLLLIETSLTTPEKNIDKEFSDAKEVSLQLQEKSKHIFEEKNKSTALLEIQNTLEKHLITFEQQEASAKKILEERSTLEKELANFKDIEERKKTLQADEEKLQELQKDSEETKRLLTIAETKLQRLQIEENICKDGECPTCGTKGDFSLHFSSKTEKEEQEIRLLKEKNQNLQKEYKRFDDMEERKKILLKNEEHIRILKEQLEKLTTQISQINEEQITQILSRIETYKIDNLIIPKVISTESLKNIGIVLVKYSTELKKDIEKEEAELQAKKQYNTALLATLEAKKSEVEKQVTEKAELTTKIELLTQEHAVLQNKKTDLQKELTRFSEDKQTHVQLTESLKTLRSAHMEYISYCKEADRLTDLEAALKAQKVATNSYLELGKKTRETHNLLKDNFNPETFEKLQEEMGGLKAFVRNADTEKKRGEQDLEVILKKLEFLREKEEEKIKAHVEKELKEKKFRKLELVRNVLNQAAEPLANMFRTRLSEKAALFFRRLTQESSMLSWGEDFEVFLIKQEEHIRKFQQLSGGEQMISALSIRLALMRYLSPFRIGFFDEPTQNLDEAHRRSLGNLLPHVLDGFEQLFLISHDDTFDALTDNVIMLEKTEDGTKVVAF